MTSLITNPKEHFICYDGLCNVSSDLNFSIFRKYRCQAGCSICYIQQDFLSNDQFSHYIPAKELINSSEYKRQLKYLFSHFRTVMSIDDLPYLRKDHPDLYGFYMDLNYPLRVSMSDNAIFRYAAITNDNQNSYTFHDVSISGEFLHRVDNKKLYASLDTLHRNTGISKIKLIVNECQSHEGEYRRLIDWATENNILTEKKLEFGSKKSNSTSVLDNIQSAQYSDDKKFTEEETYSENGNELFPIHSESLFLMQDDFYSELKSATRNDRSPPFAKLSDFDDPVSFLSRVLRGKLADYARYTTLMQDQSNQYYRYFKYVVDNLIINDNFNFIPSYLMPQASKYRERIIESGKLQLMKYGLYDHTALYPIPICEFKRS